MPAIGEAFPMSRQAAAKGLLAPCGLVCQNPLAEGKLRTRSDMRLLRVTFTSGLIGAVLSFAVTACQNSTTVAPKNDAAVDRGKVQSLQRQLQERDKVIEERDKRIEDLEAQLDALKLIDQDREKQRKPLRPPTTLEPSP